MFQICSSTSWYIFNKIPFLLWNSLWNWESIFVRSFGRGWTRVSVWTGRRFLSWNSSGFSSNNRIFSTSYICSRKNVWKLCSAVMLKMHCVNHKLRESFRLEKTFKTFKVQPFTQYCQDHHKTMSLSPTSTCLLNTSREVSTTCLGGLFQYFWCRKHHFICIFEVARVLEFLLRTWERRKYPKV